MVAARARGRKGSRRQGITKEAEKNAILAESYYKQGDMAVNKIASEIGVSKMTLYKYLRCRKVEIGNYVHQNNSEKNKYLIIRELHFSKTYNP